MGRNTGSRDLKTSIAILGDGYVEKYYFEGMKNHEETPNDWYQILPKLLQDSGSFDKSINRAIELLQEGVDKVFAIVEFDKILQDGKKREFQEKLREIEKLNEEEQGEIRISFCNPCFEYWLLIHFNYITALFGTCDKVEQNLRKEIPGYEKSQKYHSTTNLYEELYSNLGTAIANSERSDRDYHDQDSNDHPLSTIHKIFHSLRIGVNYS